MKIVVIGEGKVGYTLTRELSRAGHELLVIDNRKDTLSQTEERLDVMVMQGNGASVKVQEMAGVGKADLMIAVTSADETNLLCCMVARKLGCKHTIARIRNAEYAEDVYRLQDELGLSMTVNPERAAAREIFGLLQYPSFLKRDSFAKGRAEIVALPVREGSPMDGMKLIDLYRALRVKVLICAVERNKEVFIPDGQTELQAGDHIYVTAPMRSLTQLVKWMGIETPRIHSAILVGGSRTAAYLAQMLIEAGIDVKLIDHNHARCEQLSEELPKADIIYADGTSFGTLVSEGIGETDAVVTLTEMDEQNLIISMFANSQQVPKVVSKINREEYCTILPDNAAECVVNPLQLTSMNILRYVRAMQNRQGEGVLTLHRIVNEKVEALEFRVTENTKNIGVPLKDMQLLPNLLVACITRHNKVIVPGGMDSFMMDDRVVIVTGNDHNFNTLNDIFVGGGKA